MFLKSFEQIREKFKETFVRFFPGGEADLHLEENVDALEAQIDIIARPRGKRLQNIALLSGGERALTAIASALCHLPSQAQPVLHPRRGRCPARRRQHQPLRARAQGICPRDAIRRRNAQQDHHGGSRRLARRHHARRRGFSTRFGAGRGRGIGSRSSGLAGAEAHRQKGGPQPRPLFCAMNGVISVRSSEIKRGVQCLLGLGSRCHRIRGQLRKWPVKPLRQGCADLGRKEQFVHRT